MTPAQLLAILEGILITALAAVILYALLGAIWEKTQ